MFSGIVEETGIVAEVDIERHGRLRIEAALVLREAAPGDSIAVNGCCLTLTSASASDLAVDVMAETCRRTNLGALRPGARVNLESALVMGDRIGGHLVSGHIDAVGTVTELRDEGNARRVTVAAPAEVAWLLAPRGSVAIDGISLTVVDAGEDLFTVSLIPHTLATTTSGSWTAGTAVNLEADLIARYVRRALEPHPAPASGSPAAGRP